MRPIIPSSYQQLIHEVSHYGDLPKPDAKELLGSFGFSTFSLHAQAPIFFVVDYSRQQYLYIDPSCKTVLGYDIKSLSEAGPVFFTGLWHPHDFKVWNEQFIPDVLRFLRKQPPHTYPDFAISFNYRIRTVQGDYLTMLQRSTFYLAAEDGKPLAAVGFIIDITHFKEDTRIIGTVERTNRNFTNLSKEPLYKKIFFPDRSYGPLSKREVEVLYLLSKGYSSKQIASQLFLSENTVNNHRKNMLYKTGNRNTSELISFSKEKGLL